jgi:glycosyltransferase involved in cell wall biosynthesis
VKRLAVFLTDPLNAFHVKGEVKPRYYNPKTSFSEVHFISPAHDDIAANQVQCLVGDARLVIHSVGPAYYAHAWSSRGRIAGILSVVRPDAVRAYDPALRGAIAVHWARRLGVPALVSIHADLDEQRHHERRLVHYARVPFERYTLKRATAVICVTHHVAGYARRHGALSPVVIYNRVDTQQFAPRPESRHELGAGSRLTILTVGRLVPPKFHECLIRAVANLDVNLVIIGEGVQRRQLQMLAMQLRMSERVTFIAAVPHSEIPGHYAAADIFAIATHYEGFCIPVVEAMAAGLPVVASDIPPVRELVGNAGLLVENDPQAFSAALNRLLHDPALRSELGARARQRALTIDGAVMEKQEADLYSALIASA